MLEMDRLYSGYGLASHKGYPTPEYCEALKSLGALPIHRRSFARVREALGLDPVQTDLFAMDEQSVQSVVNVFLNRIQKETKFRQDTRTGSKEETHAHGPHGRDPETPHRAT